MEDQHKDLRTLVFKTMLFFTVVFLIYLILIIAFPDQIKAIGEWAVQHLGLSGVFLFIYLVDTFIVPASGDLIFPLTFGWNPVPLLLTMGLASMLGGFSGYLIARRLSHLKSIQNTVKHYRKQGEDLIKKYGVWAVVIAGLTPIPYSTVSWIDGLVKMPIRHYLLASLSRIPRFILYYLAIQGGFILIQGTN